MGAAAITALKKAAITMLTDRESTRKLFSVILGVILFLTLPIAAVVCIFNGEISFDEAQLTEAVVSNLTEAEKAKLMSVEDTMYSIEYAMQDAGFDKETAMQAQVLYVLALYDFSDSYGFIEKLVSCFEQGQSDAGLINNVNYAFGTDISAEEFTQIASLIRSSFIPTNGYVDVNTKNNLDLVEWVKNAETKGWGYVWGTFGQVLSRGLYNSKLQQYPEDVGGYSEFIESHWLGGRTADCIGLIKGYSWFDPETQEIDYAVNGMPDVGADTMFYSSIIRGTIDTMPEIPGLAVWHEGHIGVYIGSGEVIEAMGTMYGVVKTRLSDGYWTHWLQIPYIHYLSDEVVLTVNEKHIWDVLYEEIGNPYGAAALMGNLFAESSLYPNNLQNSYEDVLGYTDASYTAAVNSGSYTNFVNDEAGYGLAQWTDPSRKANLIAFAKEKGCSIADLDMQLEFLRWELNTLFPGVVYKLKNAGSVREASDYVLINFEAPTDQSEAVQSQRAVYGSVYYGRYAN